MSRVVTAIEVRELRPAEQAEVRDLILAGLAEHWSRLDPRLNPDLDDLARFYGHGVTLVAVERPRIVGTGTVIPRGGGRAEIVRMSVATDQRRAGVGRQLVDRLVAQASAWGCTRVVLETTSTWTGAIAFYQRCGFIATHEVGTGAGAETWFEREVLP